MIHGMAWLKIRKHSLRLAPKSKIAAGSPRFDSIYKDRSLNLSKQADFPGDTKYGFERTAKKRYTVNGCIFIVVFNNC